LQGFPARRKFGWSRAAGRFLLALMVRYRPNVAIILRRADGCILVGERSDVAGAWQFPQGGAAADETPEQALEREVLEELSLLPADYRVVARRGPYRYEFPAGRTKEDYGGQEQTYFLADFIGEEAQILSQPSTVEFQAVRWVAPMKRAVYAEVLRDFFGVEAADAGKDS
jgi:putative (di)nucleoside polyphosphate hydrolase